MNFGYTDEQNEIKSTARQFLSSRFKPERVRELADAGSYDEGAWAEIRELGWPGIAIAEEHGGQGLGMVELAILCEEVGYACAPVPFLTNAAAGLMLATAGSDEQKERYLEGSATGERPGAVGEPGLVPDAQDASFVVLLDAGRASAALLDADDATAHRLDVIDSTRAYFNVAGEAETLAGDVSAGRDRIQLALAAELTGIAQRALDMAVGYAKERHQFERPIGAYQAVSHRCADMLYEVEEARSLTLFAAWAADAEPASLPLAAAMARARAAEAAWAVTKSSLQVHGGIAFTWEHDLHFLLKRARAAGRLFGTSGGCRERVAELAGMADTVA